MRVVLFYHSLLSDWNHGNAHFLRGVAGDLIRRGHQVRIFEPQDGWSLTNLIQQHGRVPVRRFRRKYPLLSSRFFDPARLDLDEATDGSDLVIVHEWNEVDFINRIARHRRGQPYRLLFHDTHHRSVSDRKGIARCELERFDGVLAFGKVIRDLYLRSNRCRRAWTWHEAADTAVFKPRRGSKPEGDLVWIGNWGDDERAEELQEFLVRPVRKLGLRAKIYGVRYPDHALKELERAGIEYGGYLPNFDVPRVFSQYRMTVHVPRRPYVRRLPGIPTIRPFEAMACGIPLVSAPWNDSEGLFSPGQDFLTAQDGKEMARCLARLMGDEDLRRQLARQGRQTILARHTCGHRVEQLLQICSELGLQTQAQSPVVRPLPPCPAGRAERRPQPGPAQRRRTEEAAYV